MDQRCQALLWLTRTPCTWPADEYVRDTETGHYIALCKYCIHHAGWRVQRRPVDEFIDEWKPND